MNFEPKEYSLNLQSKYLNFDLLYPIYPRYLTTSDFHLFFTNPRQKCAIIKSIRDFPGNFLIV